MSQKVLNKRSSALVNGEAKLPTSQQLDYGEIAINFASGHETLSIKNSSDEIATFSSDQYFKDIIEENEYITSMALNDINSRLVSSASQLVNDVGFITGYTETDPTVPTWAKQSTKPSYTANEVGALPTGTTLDNVPDGTTRKLSNYATSANTHNAIANASGNIKSYVDSKVSSVYVYKGSVTNYSDLASITTKEVGDVYNVVNANGSTPGGTNYAWTGTEWDALGGTIDLSNYVENSSFNAHTGNSAIHLTTGDVETQITSHNYLTGYTETDPTVPNWAKQATKPAYTASEVGALPTGTTLDNVPDGTTRKLSNYATQANFTAHTASTEIHVTAAQKSSWDSKVSNVQSDWNATTGLAAILNKPTIPSAPGTLNTTATASQSTNASQSLADNITLHKVSKTGSYNDLNNKPTIPTVNDNTITLTFNGATVGTFTLNQNSNKTIDIGTIIGLPSFSSANNGQILGVVNGQLTWVTPTTIYTGTGTPSASQGNDGDIYLQTS